MSTNRDSALRLNKSSGNYLDLKSFVIFGFHTFSSEECFQEWIVCCFHLLECYFSSNFLSVGNLKNREYLGNSQQCRFILNNVWFDSARSHERSYLLVWFGLMIILTWGCHEGEQKVHFLQTNYIYMFPKRLKPNSFCIFKVHFLISNNLIVRMLLFR